MLLRVHKVLLSLFIVFVFLSNQMGFAATEFHTAFNEKMNSRINIYRTSHDMARAILKINPKNHRLIEDSKNILKKKVFLMPQYKIKGETLIFELFGKKYSVQHNHSSFYTINGQKVDIEKKGWEDQFALNSTLNNILWHEASAIAPAILYWAIIAIVGTAALSCMSIGLGSRSKPSLGASWKSAPRLFDRELNAIAREVRVACGANASEVGNFIGFQDFFNSFCQAVGNNGLALYEQKSTHARRSDGSVNQQVYPFMRQRPLEVAPHSFTQNFLNNYSFQTCIESDCSRTGSRVPYSNIDGPIQDFLEEVTSDPLFISECAEEGLKETLNPNNQSNSTETSSSQQ